MFPAYTEEEVLSVHHWTDRLFTLRTTRPAGYRFANGQFCMMGLPVDGKPLVRAYSFASANHEETLEFFSIKVPDGPLTSRLQHVKVGDKVLVGKRPTGTLTIGNLRPGRTLWLLATGTGLAPFLSVVKDPETYERFEQVILTHTCRHTEDLAYSEFLKSELPADELLGELVAPKLVYYPSVTREPFEHEGRITTLIETGRIFKDLGREPLDPKHDRLMLCGSSQMLADTADLLEAQGFEEGNSGEQGDYLVEKAFAGEKRPAKPRPDTAVV
ncbi:MAG: ferredoxin--NADP reductase [Polyangiaceae bacterium]|nr:ferredoxin--NADP reductase [Polyangiaceae bacterium]MCW5789944.1 ferredoxin--NADP reductase [Polyangiaceae bacterium]